MRFGALALLLAAAQAAAQDPISLDELRAIALARFESQQPAQLEALRPFLKDLELGYDRANRDYLDRRLDAAAELGDSIVPLLLDKLVPAQEGDELARNVAANSAGILRRIGPAGFVDPLIEIAQGTGYVGRLHAMDLLGASGSQRAARALTDLLGRLDGGLLAAAIEALAQLRAAEAAPAVASHLGAEDPRLRAAALRFLVATRAPEAVEPALEALAVEPNTQLLPLYLDYLSAVVRRSERAAAVLVPFLTRPELDRAEIEALCRALRDIAPEGHEPTLQACKEILRLQETGALGLAAALTMWSLGDRSGVSALRTALKARMNRDRKDPEPYIHRGDLGMELEEWADAARDYAEAIDRCTDASVRNYLHLQVARCEAHRRKWAAVARSLKDSNATYGTIMLQAKRDPALQQAIEQAPVRRFLDQLPRPAESPAPDSSGEHRGG